MQASVQPRRDASAQYLLRVADTCLILGQRLSEWCGHGPILEEDIALSNTALDLIGQSRALLAHAGRPLDGAAALDEDQLAFLRDERDYLNVAMVELPRGDFAFTVLRNVMVATFLKLLWLRLASSSDAEVAAIAGKAVKEARYHQQHAGDWVLRLADGTAESRQRIEAALAQLWRYTPELFESDAVDEQAAALGLGPQWSELRAPWMEEIGQLLQEAQLTPPAESVFRSTAKRGVHTEFMGHMLTEMQSLQRSFPGGVW